MRTRSSLTLIALALALPNTIIACGDDAGDAPPANGGSTAGKGGSSGRGGTAGKGGSSGKGGTAGDAGDGNGSGGEANAGSGGTTAGTSGDAGDGNGSGGEANAGSGGTTAGTSGDAGQGGGGPDPVECDLSGDGLVRETLPNEITEDLTLEAGKVYYIDGETYINGGATLTIPKCTRVEGSPAPNPGILFAQRGGRLVAAGTKDEPILFTSSGSGTKEAGQWGGIVLLGAAPITRPAGATESTFEGLGEEKYAYGGSNAEDDSGTLQYVRIEFGGFEIIVDKEINGLSMAGVGSGTTIDHVMVSNTLDDCFEWWGGTVTANYLICNNPGDDYFDADEGWQTESHHWFGRRLAYATDSDNPNGFEWDSILDGTQPFTNVKVSNVTMCGPGVASTSVEPYYGMLLRELITGEIDNLALVGFDYGIDTRDTWADQRVTLANSTFWGFKEGGGLDDNAAETDNDSGFVDGSIFTDGTDNTLDPDPVPYSAENCLAEGGPSSEVTDSGIGSFDDGAGWLDGAWVNWAEE